MNTLLASIKNPIAVFIILALCGLGWLLTKSQDIAAFLSSTSSTEESSLADQNA